VSQIIFCPRFLDVFDKGCVLRLFVEDLAQAIANSVEQDEKYDQLLDDDIARF